MARNNLEIVSIFKYIPRSESKFHPNEIFNGVGSPINEFIKEYIFEVVLKTSFFLKGPLIILEMFVVEIIFL